MNIHFDFPVTERIYKVIGERKLKLYIFEPVKSEKSNPAILFFYGGSFTKGSNTAAKFQHQARYFASKGLVAICVDYRNAYDDTFSPIQAISDAKSAVRWVRKNCIDIGVDPDKVVMCGASSGGYTVVSSIMLEPISDEKNNDTLSNIPNALVIFAAGMNGVDIMDRMFPELREVAIQLSPMHHIKKCLPPTIWFCGTADLLYESNKQFCEAMVEAGNEILFIPYKGMEHGFFNYGLNENYPYHDTIHRTEEFLQSLSLLN